MVKIFKFNVTSSVGLLTVCYVKSEVAGGVWKMLNNKTWTTLQKCEDGGCGTYNGRQL